MAVPDKVLELVERFEFNIDAYKHGRYNETQVRREFIDLLFTVLGWDVENVQGYAEAYKDVVHEDAIKVGRATKAPDYSFRIGGVRKFFVEAKKPSVDIKADTHPAYQLRRYAWSAKLPLSILTDFEEFAVYDCRIKPEKTDKASKARVLYLTYHDYPEQWETLRNTFSKEAILKGSFDQYAESNKVKKGTAEVDVAFLQEIERWRDLLARNLALRNPRLSRRELNFAVQRTIDRIIFLRICEDRGIEGYGKLMALQNGTQIYERLFKLFYQADTRYNSGIFYFTREKERPERPDALTPELKIDDHVLKDILNNLYYPDSPYEFSVLPADILGQVYEQFLGKVIRLTAGHQAKVEEKPEVKKAGGVYYTPTYIVAYIVKHTVGTLLEGKTPKQAEKLTILDPACGSGSFLLGAYQYLLDWFRDAYLSENPEKWSKGRQPRLYQNDRGEWKLTIEERKRILLNNIYGVDIDSQAVEVTKLSLLLKVLEGEDEQTLNTQLALFRQRVLPDLSNNIKCGNSLIGSDFYEGKQLTLLDEEEMYRINAFDWDKEFPEIMQKGGFDAVIGNPPYVMAELSTTEKAYLQKRFEFSEGKPDLYRYFIELSHQILRRQGTFGFIIPHSILKIPACKNLRKYLLQEGGLVQIVNFWGRVFTQASVNSVILITKKGSSHDVIRVITDQHEKPHAKTLRDAVNHAENIRKAIWLEEDGYQFTISVNEKTLRLIKKIKETSNPLEHFSRYTLGMQVYHNSLHTKQQIKERIYHCDYKKDPTYYPESGGKNIQRYCFDEHFKKYVAYGDWCYTKPDWEFFAQPRILIREITSPNLVCAYTNSVHISNKSVIILLPKTINISFLLGILNSKLIGYYVQVTTEKGNQRLFPRISLTTVKNLPICKIDFSNFTEKTRHDKMVELVQRMLDLQKQQQDAKIPQAQTLLKRQIEATDRQIDRLVYALYGLTEEEIGIIEKT